MPNHLKGSSSPYLLMHAGNPVDWHPWGGEALAKAQKQNKLIIISIGYAACHWCHVMEEESFEDSAVAELMNRYFVSIKVDREERPDIDQIYMNAAQLITGSGGWPLNAIALPDGRPVYAGTYFPKHTWMSLLAKLQQVYQDNPEKMREQAEALTMGIRRSDMVKPDTSSPDFNMDDLTGIYRAMIEGVDSVHGGHQGAPKFPMPCDWEFLLEYHHFTGDESALQSVTLTLDKMADGGIYDQIGGGFARYSTDAVWKAPHFEKMLYDNAQLAGLYASAYRATGKSLYKEIAYETLEFVSRELTSPEGAFYSSLDADSEGEEGKFYVWTKEQLEDVLGDDTQLAMGFFGATEPGNWEEGKNVLLRRNTQLMDSLSEVEALSLKNEISQIKSRLFKARTQRPVPALDNKILASWNALMLKGYVDAYLAFGDKQFLNKALANGKFLVKNMLAEDGSLQRTNKSRKTSINGFLDDYAFAIRAFIALYQATFDESWLYKAGNMLRYVLKHFYDKESGLFFYTSDLDAALIARKMELADNVIPSSNSVMAENLLLLSEYFPGSRYREQAERMAHAVKPDMLRYGRFYSKWASLYLKLVFGYVEVAIVGPEVEDKRKKLSRFFLPGMALMGGQGESRLPLLQGKPDDGKTTFYVCRNYVCKLPVQDLRKALQQIKEAGQTSP